MSNIISRLTIWQIWAIGAGMAGVVALVLFFALLKPKQEQVKKVSDDAASVETAGGTTQMVSTKQKEQKTAEADSVKVKADWSRYDAMYMPKLDLYGPDVLETYSNTLIKIPQKWGKFLEAWYRAQQNQGISLVQPLSFAIPAYPADPNYVSQIKYLTFPADGQRWSVTVNAKSFNQAMDHLARFNSIRGYGMPVINSVTLSGNSPDLQVSYTLAMHVIPGKEPPAEDPAIKSPTGSTTGGMGGMMGGMMGGRGAAMMGGGMMGGPPMGGRPSPGAAAPGGGAPAAGGKGKGDD